MAILFCGVLTKNLVRFSRPTSFASSRENSSTFLSGKVYELWQQIWCIAVGAASLRHVVGLRIKVSVGQYAFRET